MELESAWRDWVRIHDVNIRGRVARGDEDSLVNLWLFGTSFTDLPPARPHDVAVHGDGASLSQVAEGRLADLLAVLASPGSNERLRWAGQFLRSRGLDPATSRGRARFRELLEEQLHAHQSSLEALLSREVAAFNEMLRRRDVLNVITRKPTS